MEIMQKLVEVFNIFFTPIVNKVIVAVIILLIGLIIGRIFGRLMHKFLKEIELNNIVKNGINVAVDLEKGISMFIQYFVYFVAVIWALETLAIATTILYIISIAIIVVVVVSLLLGAKDFVPNIIARIFIKQKDMVKEGDDLEVDGVKGKVEEVGYSEVKIKTKSGDTIFVPNSSLLKKTIKVKKSKH